MFPTAAGEVVAKTEVVHTIERVALPSCCKGRVRKTLITSVWSAVDGVSGHSIAPDSTKGALVVRHGHQIRGGSAAGRDLRGVS